ncbi:MAG: tetratricopeptide repeat protein [Magnetococcales bacterium]|nr:tetratricopeptide repeat protein [Magnetococcales bacterium]
MSMLLRALEVAERNRGQRDLEGDGHDGSFSSRRDGGVNSGTPSMLARQDAAGEPEVSAEAVPFPAMARNEPLETIPFEVGGRQIESIPWKRSREEPWVGDSHDTSGSWDPSMAKNCQPGSESETGDVAALVFQLDPGIHEGREMGFAGEGPQAGSSRDMRPAAASMAAQAVPVTPVASAAPTGSAGHGVGPVGPTASVGLVDPAVSIGPDGLAASSARVDSATSVGPAGLAVSAVAADMAGGQSFSSPAVRGGSPENARKLRDAGSFRPVSFRRGWLPMAGFSAMILGGLALGGVVYWNTLVVRPVGGPALGRVDGASVSLPPSGPTGGVLPVVSPPGALPLASTVVSAPMVAPPPSGGAAPAPSSSPAALPLDVSQPSIAAISGETPAGLATEVMGSVPVAEMPGAVDVAEHTDRQRRGQWLERESPGASMSVSSGDEQKKEVLRLMRLRETFERGQVDEAARGYRELLARDGENKDALAGMAAVMIRRGRLRDAAGYYLELLRLDPGNTVALAGLTGIRSDHDPSGSESVIKAILQREPDAHHLHFSLGTLYAGQKRWGAAQEAFFNAMAGGGDNPDYVFNLAVSLDHLGQRASALNYYRKALELAARQPGGFDVAAVEKRIAALAMKREDLPEARAEAAENPMR